MMKIIKEPGLPQQAAPVKSVPLSAHPMKVVRDRYGRLWLCSVEIDEEKDLEAQGAWRCGDLTFSCIR